jgi:hypothetical protein
MKHRSKKTLGRKPIDLTGQRLGEWFVLGYAGNKFWHVKCVCGQKTRIDGSALRRGRSKSCGCLKGERISTAKQKYADRETTNTAEYMAWRGAITRCENKKDKNYPRWGGRGIKVADAWRKDFLAFLRHVGPRPSSKHSLDRIDNNGNYEPGNVRWATRSEQMCNRSNTQFVTIGDETLPVSEWARRTGVAPTSVLWRIRNGWPPEAAVSIPSSVEDKRQFLTRVSLRSAKE